MKKIILFFCFLIFVSLAAFILFFNSEGVRFNTITVAGKFSISIPEYLSQTDSIDASALFQCKNEKEQLFVLVYEETDTMSQPLDRFFKKYADDFISRIGHGNLIKYYPWQINSHAAYIGNIRGRVNETAVYYRIAVIQTPKSFYKIMLGVSDNNLTRYDEDMSRIINSFSLRSP